MAVAVSMQLAVPPPQAAPMQLDLPGSGDQSANASRTELVKEKNLYVSDALGNSKLVRLVERWELRTVHDRLFVKPLGRQIVERNVASQNPQTICAFKAAPYLATAVSQPAVIRNVAYPGNLIAAWRALPDRSIVSHLPMPRAVHVFVTRPDLIESPSAQIVIEVISKVAQLMALLTGGNDQLTDARQGESEDHSTSRGGGGLSQRHSISELLAHLIHSLMMQGRPEDIQKAMDLSRLEAKLSLALKDADLLADPALFQEIDSLINQYALAAEIAAEQNDPAMVNRQYNSELLKPGGINRLNTVMEHDGLSVPAKSGVNNGHGEHEQNNGEGSDSQGKIQGKKSANEVGRAEPGNKVSINTSINNSAAPISSGQVMGSLNQLLASMGLANIAAQPPLAVESGQKHLPPIILPTANPGNRSDKRRKSRKELKEEEEKEREGAGTSFLFDDEPFEPFDDE